MMTKIRVPSQTVRLQAKLFRGFSDRSRLAILEVLRHGPLPAGEIATATGLTQPNASNHLKCLGECGLVVGEPKGRFVYYRLADERVAAILQLADELLVDVVPGLRECANYRDEQNAVIDTGRQMAAKRGRPRIR